MSCYDRWMYSKFFFFFKQKTAYEMRISDWSSDVCSSDLSSALIEDARRDWQALGGTPLDIQPLGRVRAGAGIGIGDAILFASYATLRSEAGGERRVDQILTWLGDGFEGLILFDAAHAMGGVAGDRKSVGWGKSVSVRVDIGGGGYIKKKN